MAGSILGFSLPTFWVGLMMIMLFAVYLGWLPSTGRGETAARFLASRSSLWTRDGLSPYLFMPALNLALTNISAGHPPDPRRACARPCTRITSSSPAPKGSAATAGSFGVHLMKNIHDPRSSRSYGSGVR